MSETCPVCEHTVDDGATKCDNCGFEDRLGIDRVWPNAEDGDRWIETTVKPYRVGWEMRKQNEELRSQLEAVKEAAKKREAELLAQLENAKNRKVEPTGWPISFTDPRDGQVYRAVKIVGLIWMAENLNYKTSNSWCYDDDESNGRKYGRLYTWDAAKAACPRGWRLPTSEEWNKLAEAMGGDGTKLKSKSGWNYNNPTDEFGFSALPGGLRYYNYGGFDTIGYRGHWWSATEYDSCSAYSWYMEGQYPQVNVHNYYKSYGFSVRCVGAA